MVKKYINKYLKKGFIRLNKLLVILFILFIYKLKSRLYFYIDYYTLNKLIIKN